MEGKSKGLIAGGVDGGGYGSRPQTVAAEGLVPLPMAGDPTFYWTDLGASALKNNEGFRMGDLSVRTGEEFAAAFSHMAMKGRSGAEGRSVLHKMPLGKGAVQGELGNNNPFSYEEFAGTSGQMPLSRNPEISQMTGEKDRSTAEFRNNYGDVYSESGRAAQFFRAADESECRSDEFQRLPTSVHQEHLSGVGADDLTSHKVKFMCSFGGKILPRPSDGNLRYVGGETRIITVNRGIGFAELMQKMLDIYGQALLLKYQLPDEDLDALVSVSSDEDLENMMDEYGRLLEGSSEGSSRLRVFLFSATDSDLDHLAAIGDRRNSEQRYVDAVNGIAETGFTKHDDSITSVSSRHLENLIGLDVADNWNTTPWDPEGMSASLLSTRIIPQDVTNLGHPPPPNPSSSSKEAVAKAPSVTSSAPSSSPLSSLPNHLKQAGVGDISMQFLPEQNSKTGGNAYSVVRPPDGGGGYRDLDYGVTTLSTATSQNELRHRIAGPAREAGSPSKARHDYMLSPVSHPDSVYLADPLLNDTKLSGVDSHGKLNWQQEKFEVTQPMMDHRSDGQPPPLDSQRFVLQQPPPPVRWQQYVDAHQDTYGRADYIQHANSDGHVQQLFQQQSLQSPHVNNPQLSIHEGGVYRHANRAHPQHQDDLFGGPYLPKFIASHPLGQGVTTAAALQQMGSDPSSPRLAGRQIGSGQQHVQVHQQSNVPYSEQQSFGARVPYYNDQSNRALHPPSSPPQHHGQVFERVVRQHELPYEQLPHQQKTRPEQVPHADESCIHRQAMHHAHSETVLQEKVMKPVRPLYEGIQISQTHHSDGSARPVPSCAASSALQEGLTSYHGHQDMSGGGRSKISHQGKESQTIFSRESQPILSRQQGYTITHGGMEYRVEPPSSLPHFHERPNEYDWVPQHRTQELDEAKVHFALRGRMAHTEEKGKEWSDELSGSCFAEPAVSFGGIGVSKGPNTLLGQGLGDSYQSHQQTEMFESLGASLCQLNQPVAAGDLGATGILPDALQATRLYGKVNEVAASRPGLNGEEVRTADPAKEHVISSQAVSINSWLPGVTQGHMEERLAGIALNPYVYTTGVEPSIPSSMSTEWWGGNHGTDQAKVEASPSDLKQKGDSCGGQSRDALPFITNNETIILSDTYERLTLDEKSGNSMHISEQHPAESLRERITADDSGYLSYVPPDVTSNTRSLDKMKGGISDSAVVTLSESNSFCVPEQHVVQLQGKGIVDDDSGHSACVLIDVSPNTSSLDKLKEGDSHSVAATLPASISYSDSLRDLLKGSSASTTVPTSNTTEPLAKDDLLRRSNDPVSIGLLIEEDGTSRELDSIKDGLSKGLPPEALLLSDKGEVQDHADEDVKGELENVAEDVKVQVHSSQEELTKGVDEETIPTLDLNFEEPNTDDVDKDEPDAVIKEAISHGLQTIKNADLEELRELGSGTFGTVYHGKWRGSDVAIKRIKNSCFMGKPSEQERLRADFWREACMLAQLHHPNVVAFYGVVPDGPGGTLATVTEYMVNGSLKQVMHRKDRMIDRRKRLLIAMDAAFGMEYLHGKNIVHFDLKCENLLVNMRDPQRPICKVGDLGLSKIKHQTLVSGGVRGTLPWMAPELLNGSSSMVSEKVDVFSFGIVMWELLTGEEPYANMHYGAIIGGIVNNTLRPPIPNWCDTAWRSLMEHCWSADPSARPSFTEITNALRAMAASLPPKGQGHQAHPQVHAQN